MNLPNFSQEAKSEIGEDQSYGGIRDGDHGKICSHGLIDAFMLDLQTRGEEGQGAMV